MKKYIPYIVILVLVVILIFNFTNNGEVVIEKNTTDTVTIVEFDTIYEPKPIFLKETIIDTIYLEKSENGDYMLPIMQRYYRSDNYEAWVSGFQPNLDSVRVFNKTITNTVTNTITKEIYPKTMDLYFNAGISCVGSSFYPNIGLSLKTKRDLMLMGEVGYFDNKVYYGGKIGFKINKRR